ncbi:MAG: DUF3343 domain-containing protein [Clostridia bacterium]|nr:DUF3343 domain-containing protein [Clostridia bacterium]
MEECILTIGTVTGAIRARKLLAAAGIGARLIKNTGTTKAGCAYGLTVTAANMPLAMRTLNEHDIAFEWSRGRAAGNK